MGSPSLVEVKGITKRFGSLAALNDVSFEVKEGELFGIAGPNGAGKSVLFSVISGFYQPTSGSVVFEGKDLVGLGPHQVCHRGLTRTFQTPAMFPSMTVRENVLVGGLFGARGADRVPETLSFLGLDAVAQAEAANLDLYTTKKVVIAAALATDCRVLMMDEPMAGFSHVEIESFLDLVRRINEEWGVTIVIIEHLLDVLIGITDRMMILNNGEVLYCGSPDAVKSDQRVVDVYLGGVTEG